MTLNWSVLKHWVTKRMNYQSVETDAAREIEQAYDVNPQLSHASRGYVLYVFMLISSATTITAVICIISLAIFMVISLPPSDAPSGNFWIQTIIQFYEIILLLAIIVVEMEWTEAIRSMTILQSWGIRGLCYSFVGLIVYQDLGGLTSIPSTSEYPYIKVPCVVLIGLGLIYSLMVKEWPTLCCN